MIRTVWLALACLAVLGTLAVGKAAFTTPVAPASAQRPANEATIGTDITQDTLAKGDRLEITYVHQEISAHSASQSTGSLIPPVPTIVPPVERKIISRHWHDPNATTSSGAKSKPPKRTVATEKGKSVDPKSNQAADRSKPTEQAKLCNRTSAFGDLMRSLNLSPACDS
jgi:hypothetical protein